MVREDVQVGNGTIIYNRELVNLYGCLIGKNCKIASFVEIQSGVTIGNNSKIEAFAFIPTGVTIEEGVFIGPHVCFTNDRNPRAVNAKGNLLSSDEWQIVPTVVRRGASIGANVTIVCGVTIGEGAFIAAGSVVVKNVEPFSRVCGIPAKKMRSTL